MTRDFQNEAFAETERSLALKQWFQDRIAKIHQAITAADVLARHGVSLKKHGGQEEQISCPFHGTDNRPSARYYPETSTKPSHVWCFVCREPHWDAIGLWKKYSGDTKKFSELLFHLEKAFGITPPEFHRAPSMEDAYDPAREDVENLIRVCEHRLTQERDCFDMTSHLKLGSILDLIRAEVERGGLPLDQAKLRLSQVRDKIGQKIRATTTDIAD